MNMANELMRNGTKAVQNRATGALGRPAKKAATKAAKKTAKKAAKKSVHSAAAGGQASQGGLRTAFHHMQRAAVVISLMEKGSGEDLRGLLARGVKLYEKAVAGEDDAALLRAIGVLRAAEHLALAGLYDARHKFREKVAEPQGPWLDDFLSETRSRLARVRRTERGKGADLFPAAEELVERAKEAGDDSHLACELVMAADALCLALENGL